MGIAKLAFSELRHNYQPWLAVVAVATITAMCIHLMLSLAVAGSAATDSAVHDAYTTIGGGIMSLTAPTAIISMAITASLCVRLSNKTVAKWQLAGVLPRQAGRVIHAQLLVVCVIGSILGVILGYILWPLFCKLMVEALLPDSPAFHTAPPAAAIIWTILAIVAVGYLAGISAARRTRKVEPIEVLRSVESNERKIGPLRIVIAIILLGGIIGGIFAIANQPPAQNYDTIMGLAMIFIPFVMAIFALIVALGPILFGWTMRFWTAIIPAKWSASWYLARNSARYHLSYSTAVITPLLIAAGVVGATYSWLALDLNVSAATGMAFTGTGAPWAQMVSLFGPAVLVAAVTTAGVIFATARDKERETALLIVGGATQKPIILKAIFESLIFVITTVILIAIAFGAGIFLYTWALDMGPIAGVKLIGFPSSTLAVVGIGFVMIFFATLMPVIGSLRGNIVNVLRSE